MPIINNKQGILATALLLIVLAGCGSENSQTLTLSGALTYADETPIPAQSNARISMIEHGEDGMNKRIVAERSLYNLGQKPIRFDLDVARNLVDPQGRYGLSAEIVAAGGDVRWATPHPVRVKPLERKKPVSLILEAIPQQPGLMLKRFRCQDGFHLSAAIMDHESIVRLGNRRLALQPSDWGDKRYEDDYGNKLWLTDAGLTFHVDGGTHDNCKPVADRTTQAPSDSPEDKEKRNSRVQNPSDDSNGGAKP